MSQVSSYIGGAVPGAGIQTITGNNGAINVGPDGAGDVIIQGAGDITVTGDALTHTLTITSAGVAGTYATDVGNAIPAAGVLNVIGTVDEVNTLGFGNTIRIGLPANVQIANNLDVGSTLTVWNELMVVNDISSTLGSIYALFGDIVSGNSLVGQDLVVFNGIDVTGPSVFQSLNRGVVQVYAVHTLFTSEGANGQLLIGSSTGPALWAHLTAGAGIAITNAANSITIEATGALASTYRTDGGDALPNLGIIRIVGGANIGTTGAGNTVTVSLDPNIVLTSVVATNITANADLNGHDVHVGHDLQVTNAIATSSLTATGAIQGAAINSTQDITATRDVNAGRDVNAVRNVIAQSVTATDHIETLNNLYVATHNGVLQSDGTGLVSATNGNPAGTNGQLLISSGLAAPSWHALESADGSVQITYPGDARINLRAVGGVPNPAYTYAFKAVYSGTKVITLNTNEYIPADSVAIGDQGYDANPGAHGVNLGDPFIFRAPSAGLYSFTANFFILFTGSPSTPTSLREVYVLFNQDDDTDRLVRLHLPYATTFGPSATPGRLALSLSNTTNLYLFAGTNVKIGFRLNGSTGASSVIRLRNGDFANQRMTYITGYKIA